MDQVIIKLFFLVLFVLLFCLWASFLVIIERSKVLICVSGGKKNPFPMTVIDLKQRFLSNKKKKLYVCIRRILEEFLIRLLMGKMMGNTFHY